MNFLYIIVLAILLLYLLYRGYIFIIVLLFLYLAYSNLFYKKVEINNSVYVYKTPCNMRSGPGGIYDVKVIYKQKYIPLLMIKKYKDWRLVSDIDGKEGWIHKSILRKNIKFFMVNKLVKFKNLSVDKYVIVEGDKVIHKDSISAKINNKFYETFKCSDLWPTI